MVNFILRKVGYKNIFFIKKSNSHKIVCKSNLRSISIEFLFRVYVSGCLRRRFSVSVPQESVCIVSGVQVDPYICLDVYVDHSIVFGVQVDFSIVFYVKQHLSIVSSVQVDLFIVLGVWVERSIVFGVRVDLSIVFDVQVLFFIVSNVQVDRCIVSYTHVDLFREEKREVLGHQKLSRDFV